MEETLVKRRYIVPELKSKGSQRDDQVFMLGENGDDQISESDVKDMLAKLRGGAAMAL